MSIISEQIKGDIINVDVNSSNIKKASYNTTTKELTITFNTLQKYIYENVDWSIFAKFRMNESQGKYFNEHIKKNYKFKKIDD